MTVFSVLYTFGVAHAHPATSAIVLMCGPIWATVLSRLMLGTGTPQGFALTLLLVVAGGVLVVLGAPHKGPRKFGLEGGEPLLVIAQLCWSWYSIRAQQWLSDRGQIALSALTSTVAAVLLGAVCAAIAVSGGIEWPTRVPSTVEWGMIAWIGVLGVAVAVILWNVGVSLVGVPVAILYIVGNLALGVHLYHGVWSLFQSMGWNNPRFNKWRRQVAIAFATIIVVGNVSFPVAVLAGVVG